ncbi:MAG: hypothetical protein KA296_05415, partial [Marinobacter sp.]|nr:hypothetical protein [Marinobacter sp.]
AHEADAAADATAPSDAAADATAVSASPEKNRHGFWPLAVFFVLGFGGCLLVYWSRQNRYKHPQAGPASNHRLLSFSCRMKLRFINARLHPCALLSGHPWPPKFCRGQYTNRRFDLSESLQKTLLYELLSLSGSLGDI